MSLAKFFSLGSAASARLPITNRISRSEANGEADQDQERKKVFDEAKHLGPADGSSTEHTPFPGSGVHIAVKWKIRPFKLRAPHCFSLRISRR
jgi:hypothetical protein